MTEASYVIGPPRRPHILHDNGFLDRFAPRAPQPTDYVRFTKWWGILEGAEAAQRVPFLPHNDIPDALAAYRHFLEGTGTDRTFNFERYVAHDSSGRTTLENMMVEARNAAIDAYRRNYDGRDQVFDITGTALAAGNHSTLFPYPATENWQKAIGAYNFWISCNVVVIRLSGQPNFYVDATVHVEDMYNFNPGMQDIATGIPDADNGVFEVTGLARQYLNVATLTRHLVWVGTIPASGTVRVSINDRNAEGRQRMPSDNRRVRNTL